METTETESKNRICIRCKCSLTESTPYDYHSSFNECLANLEIKQTVALESIAESLKYFMSLVKKDEDQKEKQHKNGL
jgi:hypothetical protein